MNCLLPWFSRHSVSGCRLLLLLTAAMGSLIASHEASAEDASGAATGQGASAAADAVPENSPATFRAGDTLRTGQEQQARARECLEFLTWKPEPFEVSVEQAQGDRSGCDRLVRFPSAVPAGNSRLDSVVLEWYIARDEAVPALRGTPSAAAEPAGQGNTNPQAADSTPQNATKPEGNNRPAVVVVHESGRGMTVGRLFARTLRNGGVHTFLIQLPHYGHRRVEHPQPEERPFDQVIRQSVADVRRARDAVAALPGVDPSRISLQGTSLGGFVSTTVGSLDPGYQNVFLMLCGGDLHQVITSGRNEAASLRKRLEQAGLKGDQLKQMLDRIEPSHIAHRLSPATTWLYSARDDQVVPLDSAEQLAKTAGLTPEHHIIFAGNHYSAIAHFLPVVMHILEQVRGNRPVELKPAAAAEP